jgi:hypothetical protein
VPDRGVSPAGRPTRGFDFAGDEIAPSPIWPRCPGGNALAGITRDKCPRPASTNVIAFIVFPGSDVDLFDRCTFRDMLHIDEIDTA